MNRSYFDYDIFSRCLKYKRAIVNFVYVKA